MLDSSLVFCTLLGPEGPGRRCAVERQPVPIGPLDHDLRVTVFGLRSGWELVPRQKEYRPYFENYTVDASILDSNSNVRIT
jgi:hypothetical protein